MRALDKIQGFKFLTKVMRLLCSEEHQYTLSDFDKYFDQTDCHQAQSLDKSAFKSYIEQKVA